ncbi:DUF3137 domain-containing protein [Ferrimonas sediminicola]|uniref:DUF3137 domain-containing protein n=1 Tax=Ferrimonas sediminicola TaxID=2569538 RepID=A0A4U1BIC4_9GAMM|nr:DUF3137 domain-containing protein [Ferrimonas sediminicola]TKB50299.1 DUF3137 domain-containing protein [Ferrimonas sediminicola]
MSHNKQVTANIDRIKADVEAATSQDQLIQVITSVQNHPGPLDYNDKLARAMMWLLMGIAVLGAVINHAMGNRYSSLAIVPYALVDSSVYWVPAMVAFAVGRHFHNHGKLPTLPGLLNRSWVVPALIAVVVGLLAQLPPWQMAYWFTLGNLLMLLTLGGQVYFGLEISFGALLLGVGLYLWLRKRKHWRDPVSDRIQHLDILFNNNLLQERVDATGKARQLGRLFRDFDRGNYSREIRALYSGDCTGEVHDFGYQLYHFHYVDKRTETYTDSDGKTRTRTRYDHYDRYGVLLAFPFAKGVSLDGDSRLRFYGDKYTSASNAFNRAFKVRARDQMEAARLLTPAVVELLTEFGSRFRQPVIEITDKGKMCIAFDDKDLLKLERRHGLDQPDAFKEEIAGHAKLEKLDTLLEMVHNLMRLSDNNFA